MITQAKIKNTIADFSGVSAAYFGYQDRYRATPGDDKDVDTRWPGATKGSGDRVLTGPYFGGAATDESQLWWNHLRRAGFITGAPTDSSNPPNSFGGILGVQGGDGAGGAVFGDMRQILMCSTRLPDKVAISVDVQMDDGKPDTGFVRALANITGGEPPVTGAAATPNYVENGTNLYLLCRQF